MYRTYNRPQQYFATNRMFGPYLPPYPLQGVGAIGLGTDCSVANTNLAVSKSAYNAVATACSQGSADDCINLPSVKATMDAAQAEVDTCTTPKNLDVLPPQPKPPEPIPPQPIPPQPIPPQPIPPQPKPPEPPKPQPAAASGTNWMLWIGIAAAAGVVGILAFGKKKG